MAGYEEFEGQHMLVPALESLVEGDGELDMVVVRDFVTDQKLLVDLNDSSQQNDRVNQRQLYEAVPSLRDVNDFVQRVWPTIGYTGMQATGFMLDQVRPRGISPHLDEPVYGKKSLEAVAQGSLCVQGRRYFAAERLSASFKNPDSSFDIEGYNTYIRGLSPEIWNGRVPRTRVEAQKGDAVFFAHHPFITLHSVTHRKQEDGQSEGSVARLLTWRAREIEPANA